MTDKEFTDEEIIHHLDCYENLGYRWCGYAINLINRQKAEIEMLQGALKAEETHNELTMECAKKALAIARAEAIKEFAERSKARIKDKFSYRKGTDGGELNGQYLFEK